MLLGVLEARERIADRRSARHIGNGGVDLGRLRKRNRVVAFVVRTHREQLRHVAAAGACVDPELRRVAVPGRGLPLEPAHAVVGVLHGGGIRRFRRVRHIDRDHQQPALRQRAIHRFFRRAVLGIPRAAVQIQDRGKWSRAVRTIDTRLQHASGRVLPHVDFAHADLEFRARVVGRRVGRHQTREHRYSSSRQEKLSPTDLIVGHLDLPRNDK